MSTTGPHLQVPDVHPLPSMNAKTCQTNPPAPRRTTPTAPSRRTMTGFSLMELVVTLALLGVLAGLAAPLAELAVQRSKERQLRQGLDTLRQAIDSYKRAADTGLITVKPGGSGYPPSLNALTNAAPVAAKDKTAAAASASAAAAGIIFLRQLPRDPYADPDLPAAATWGLRSYGSPPDQPQAGDDVFDVYSRAEGKGLNGVPLREW